MEGAPAKEEAALTVAEALQSLSAQEQAPASGQQAINPPEKAQAAPGSASGEPEAASGEQAPVREQAEAAPGQQGDEKQANEAQSAQDGDGKGEGKGSKDTGPSFPKLPKGASSGIYSSMLNLPPSAAEGNDSASEDESKRKRRPKVAKEFELDPTFMTKVVSEGPRKGKRRFTCVYCIDPFDSKCSHDFDETDKAYRYIRSPNHTSDALLDQLLELLTHEWRLVRDLNILCYRVAPATYATLKDRDANDPERRRSFKARVIAGLINSPNLVNKSLADLYPMRFKIRMLCDRHLEARKLLPELKTEAYMQWAYEFGREWEKDELQRLIIRSREEPFTDCPDADLQQACPYLDGWPPTPEPEPTSKPEVTEPSAEAATPEPSLVKAQEEISPVVPAVVEPSPKKRRRRRKKPEAEPSISTPVNGTPEHKKQRLEIPQPEQETIHVSSLGVESSAPSLAVEPKRKSPERFPTSSVAPSANAPEDSYYDVFPNPDSSEPEDRTWTFHNFGRINHEEFVATVRPLGPARPIKKFTEPILTRGNLKKNSATAKRSGGGSTMKEPATFTTPMLGAKTLAERIEKQSSAVDLAPRAVSQTFTEMSPVRPMADIDRQALEYARVHLRQFENR